jgi:hypothetical protein
MRSVIPSHEAGKLFYLLHNPVLVFSRAGPSRLYLVGLSAIIASLSPKRRPGSVAGLRRHARLYQTNALKSRDEESGREDGSKA